MARPIAKDLRLSQQLAPQ